MDPVVELSARQLRDAVASRTVTAERAAAAYLARIRALDPAIHAYNEVWHEAALERARALDRAIAAGQKAGPLAGVPVALKDNLCTVQGHTTCSSRILAGYRAPYTATVVRRLEEAGAVILGKTNMDEFAMGSSTEHSAHGPTRNPWDPERVPGGSSGGAAAAVAADLAWFALGSDTGGSVRQPAHCCGLVGLKPTYGRVSRRGLVAFASSLDQVGPLTKDVADCAAVYAAIAGHDPGDSTSLDAPVGDPLAAVERPPRGLAVGVPRALLETGLAPDVAADFASCLRDLQAQGVAVVDVALPALPYAVAAYCVLATAEASANLARYDGARYGARAAGRDYAAMAAATRAAGFGPEVKRRILLGAYVLSAGYYDAYYRRALAARGRLGADFARAFAACDAVALPTAPTAAFRLGERTGDPLRMYLSDVFTTAANLAGLPAVTVPTGIDGDGLPLSLQLIGPALREETLLTLAAAVERARGFRAWKEAAWTSRR